MDFIEHCYTIDLEDFYTRYVESMTYNFQTTISNKRLHDLELYIVTVSTADMSRHSLY